MKKNKIIFLILLVIVLSCKKKETNKILIETHKKVSINKPNDTLVILDNTMIVFFEPNDDEIEALKEKHGEDNFYIIADDVMGYVANITEQFDTKKIKYVTTELKVINFKNLGLFINKDELKSKWSIVYVDKNQKIQANAPIDFNINDVFTNENKIKLLFKCNRNDNGKSRYDDPLNKTCECNENTFERAYTMFYNESPDYLKKDLLEKLPQKDFLWKSEDADVSYKWILRDTLKIEMSYDGGENNYVFYKNSSNKMEYKEYLSLP